MITTLGRGDLSLRAKPNEWLTLEEMKESLPSIFATEAHESRSERYVYISTADMIGRLMDADFVPVEARMGRTRDAVRQGFTRHLLRFRARNDVVNYVKTERRVGDTTYEVILRNGHDGSSSWQFMAGLLKLLCLNGLVVSDGTISLVKVLHSGNRERLMTNVVEGAQRVLEQGPAIIEKVREWSKIILDLEERLAFADAVRTLRFGDDEGKVVSPITPAQLLIPRRVQDTKDDLWTVMNVIQENTVMGGLTAEGNDRHGRPRSTTTREIRNIDGNLRLNRGIWELTETLAGMKA